MSVLLRKDNAGDSVVEEFVDNLQSRSSVVVQIDTQESCLLEWANDNQVICSRNRFMPLITI